MVRCCAWVNNWSVVRVIGVFRTRVARSTTMHQNDVRRLLTAPPGQHKLGLPSRRWTTSPCAGSSSTRGATPTWTTGIRRGDRRLHGGRQPHQPVPAPVDAPVDRGAVRHRPATGIRQAVQLLAARRQSLLRGAPRRDGVPGRDDLDQPTQRAAADGHAYLDAVRRARHHLSQRLGRRAAPPGALVRRRAARAWSAHSASGS